MANERLKILSEKALNTPELPGVYIMRDAKKQIIYIGKAKILKNRVSQYFREGERHEPKVQKMVDNVFDFDYVVCTSEFEALILECSLIKQNQPKYNILLKDDKGYHYIKITTGSWPRITAEKQKTDDNAQYLGPYNSGFAVSGAVEEVNRIFKLPTCNRNFEKERKKSRPCLNYSIGRCCAPCAGKISAGEYSGLIDQAIGYLKTGKKETVSLLKEEMERFAENLEFEKAARLRDRVKAIESVYQKQHIFASKIEEQDVIALAHGYDTACFEVFRFTKGRLFDREHFFVENMKDKAALRGEFIKRYYSMSDRIPPQITVDELPEDAAVLEEWLSSLSGKKVAFHVPKRGEQAALIDMCRKNAAERITVKDGRRRNGVLDELAALCSLEKLPEYIEAYDISHTAGSFTVGGMITFKNAKPYRSGYRRFKVEGLTANDDCAAMKQVLERRIGEYKKALSAESPAGNIPYKTVTDGQVSEKEKTGGKPEKEGFERLPDLILLDGGAMQLEAALSVAKSEGFNVPMFGMVKDDHHKTRALVGTGGEIEIKPTRSVFTLISQIQDEVHRYAVTYHRSRRSGETFKSELEDIPGIGKTRARELIMHFRSIQSLAQAEVEEISRVKGMNMPAAVRLKEYLNGQINDRDEEENN